MQTTAELVIDLKALCQNWRTMAALAPTSETAAVIKADAYGLGMLPVAKALYNAGCTTFFVAHLSEAIDLRASLPTAVTIYVLHGIAHANPNDFAANNLRPVLSSDADFARWAKAIGSGQVDHGAALHVDTGMNRMGISQQAFTALAGKPLPFQLSLLLSHFVESEVENSAITARQIKDFATLRALMPDVPASLANSSGVFIKAAQHTLNRVGYALYGGNPTPYAPNPMQAAVTLKAPLLRIQTVPSNSTVGYNASFTTKRTTSLATFAMGYADGWLRSGSNKTSIMIGGHACPLVGNVSMDLIIADVTDVPAAILERTTHGELINATLDIDSVAHRMGTIGYELLTRLGKRLPRHYTSD